MTAEVSEPLQKFIYVKKEWSWIGMYYGLYDKAKNIIMQDKCMKSYDALKPLYCEMRFQTPQCSSPLHSKAKAYPVQNGGIAA